jgi:hypothetical protein
VTRIKIYIVCILIAAALTVLSSFVRSPWQTYPDGIARSARQGCSYPPMPGTRCSAIHSVDFGFPFHVRKVNDGIYYPDVMVGTYFNLTGIIINSLLYFAIALIIFFFAQGLKKSK